MTRPPIPALALLASLAAAPLAAQPLDPSTLLKTAVALACDEMVADAEALGRALPGEARVVADEKIERLGQDFGWRRKFALAAGGALEIRRFAPGGRLRAAQADYDAPTLDGARPEMTVIAGPDCVIRQGRRLVYGADGRPSVLEILDSELAPTGIVEALNPPLPAGRDPGGVTVALVDSGVNYLLPEIAGALARDATGEALGYDYWDMDQRPFDANPARSPFFPARHGTLVASVLLREAPGTRLIPYRYPRPDMSRMAALVEDAAAKGARIVSLSMGSNRREEWRPFEAAAEAHPEILFLASAGNDDRDIDEQPVYPAALALDNMIVVTSADGFGRPAERSNWGKQAVDLLVPGERIPVLTFQGEPGEASGSSFATPRVAALAARLLARRPEWSAAELKAAILAKARMTDAGLAPTVAYGWIADPLAE